MEWGHGMPIHLEWYDALLRLLLAGLGGCLLGLNRTEKNKPAGIRTTILVSLAAATAMIQSNLLLATGEKDPATFVRLDVMRLPLGILTGMGFIGAGAIVRKGGSVEGVTTAATLWLATVVGLGFGGGHHGLALASLVLGIATLMGLTKLEHRVVQERRATLSIELTEEGPRPEEIQADIVSAGAKIENRKIALRKGTSFHHFAQWKLRLPCKVKDDRWERIVEHLMNDPGVLSVRWSE
jgi:putative Mg2+ transporter-C (MgtC) family protein